MCSRSGLAMGASFSKKSFSPSLPVSPLLLPRASLPLYFPLPPYPLSPFSLHFLCTLDMWVLRTETIASVVARSHTCDYILASVVAREGMCTTPTPLKWVPKVRVCPSLTPSSTLQPGISRHGGKRRVLGSYTSPRPLPMAVCKGNGHLR